MKKEYRLIGEDKNGDQVYEGDDVLTMCPIDEGRLSYIVKCDDWNCIRSCMNQWGINDIEAIEAWNIRSY